MVHSCRVYSSCKALEGHTHLQGLKVPVTCKIRVFPELEKTLAYARMLERAGCSVLAVHGRTREQKQAKAVRADWNIIKVVSSSKLLIVVVKFGFHVISMVSYGCCTSAVCCKSTHLLLAYTRLVVNPLGAA